MSNFDRKAGPPGGPGDVAAAAVRVPPTYEAEAGPPGGPGNFAADAGPPGGPGDFESAFEETTTERES